MTLAVWPACAPTAAQSFQKPVLHRQAMHTQAAGTVAYSNAEKNLFASGSEDATVKLYEASGGREIRTLRGHEKQVYQVAFSPDSELLASASEDGTARIWKVRTGELVHTLNGHGGPMTSVAFNLGGDLLASGGQDNHARVWNVATGREVRVLLGHAGYVTAVTFSRADDSLLATGAADNEVRLWDARSGTLLHTFKGHDGGVNALAFSPRGNLLASGSRDYTVRLWDVRAKAARAILDGHAYSVTSLSFTPDGSTLASSSEDHTIRLWSVGSASLIRTLDAHGFRADSVDFSPDGRRFISSGADETIKVWDIASSAVLLELRLQSSPEMPVAFSRDGKRLAAAKLNEISLQVVGEGREAQTLRGHSAFVTALAFSEDGELLASASEDRTAKLWNVRSGREVTTLGGDGTKVIRLAFSPDGKRLASQEEDEVVRLWSTETFRETLRLTDHPASVTSLAFGRGGETLACGYWNGDIKLWNAADGGVRKHIKAARFSSPVAALAFNPDGRMLASGEWVIGKVKLWDAGAGRLLHEFGGPPAGGQAAGPTHDDFVMSVAFSNDGKRLVSGGRDAAVKVWSTESKQQLAVFRGHAATVKEAKLLPGGVSVLSGGADGEFIIWRAADGVELARLVQVGGDDWLAVAPDGLFDSSPDAWRQLIWRFTNNTFDFAPVESFYNEFFYPGLLKEILEGKRPVAPRNFAALDRRQPKVTVSVAPAAGGGAAPAARTAEVRVDVTEAAADAAKGLPAGEARDVRLFRNGSLVKVWRGRTVAELQ